MGPIGTNFRGIWIKISQFSLTEIILKMSSAKCRPLFSVSMWIHLHVWHMWGPWPQQCWSPVWSSVQFGWQAGPVTTQTTTSWWRHQLETFSALLALCEGNPPVTGGFLSQRPVTQHSFDIFFDVRLNKRSNKQSRCWWFETPWRSLCSHCNDMNVCINTFWIRLFSTRTFWRHF